MINFVFSPELMRWSSKNFLMKKISANLFCRKHTRRHVWDVNDVPMWWRKNKKEKNRRWLIIKTPQCFTWLIKLLLLPVSGQSRIWSWSACLPVRAYITSPIKLARAYLASHRGKSNDVIGMAGFCLFTQRKSDPYLLQLLPNCQLARRFFSREVRYACVTRFS